jgi:3-phenylpropionate/trans-cinnamate dioxygenase ferredoxin reductase subunit
MARTTVIIGASHGGVQVAASLRELNYAGRIVLVADEPHLPYHRPPLSKALLDSTQPDGQMLRPSSFYEQKDITLRLGRRVGAIDADDHSVRLDDGETIAFDNLVLATGARARIPAIEGVQLDNVLTLRTLPDAKSLAASLANASNVVVLGAGMIGLEFAAVAARAGRKTTVIDATSRALTRALSSEMAQFLQNSHEAHGVRFVFDDGIAAIEGDGSVSSVITKSGERIAADLVLVAAGVIPNVELAASAGLLVDNGIVVDEHLQTSQPGIYAVGDCAEFPALDGSRLRIESVQNATDHARTVAASIAGQPQPFNKVPWFWSDQYDSKLQIAGLWIGYDQAIQRKASNGASFAYYLFAKDRLICVESINSPIDHVAARKIMTDGLDLRPEHVAAPGFDPKLFMRQ